MRLFWIDHEDVTYPSLQQDIDVDLAIIGGGLAGVGAAYAVADAGARVVLLEERTLASGASGRNAGFVLAGPAKSYEEAVVSMGADAARDVWSFTLENNRLMADLVDRYDIDCGYLRRGSMSLSASPEEWVDLHQTHVDLTAAGIQTCLVEADQLPQPFDRIYTGGIYYPGNAEINPGRFVRGVAAGIADRVQFFECTKVLSMQAGNTWTLGTGNATVRAENVLLATNAWTPQLVPAAPIVPVRGQVVATERLDRVVVPFPMYADRGYQYWRQTLDGHLIAGGWRNLDIENEARHEEATTPRIQDALDAMIETIAPGTIIERRWAGIMGFTPDIVPMVGPVSGMDALWLAAGFSGHGVSMAFTSGGRAALRTLGQPAAIPPAFDPARWGQSGEESSRLARRSRSSSCMMMRPAAARHTRARTSSRSDAINRPPLATDDVLYV